MAALQIPFTKWDWPSGSSSSNRIEFCKDDSSTTIMTARSTCSLVSTTRASQSVVQLPCQSVNDLSSMLLEGQAVLAHQVGSQIWLFVGLSNGSIWKWTLNDENSNLPAELVMTGHKSPIKALAMAHYRTDYTTTSTATSNNNEIALVESLISLDEAGEMAVWNCHDGRCLLHNLRATATGKSAGFATSISVSPNSEYCVVAGFSDKLVILKLASLEIVQIVEVGGGREPRWVRSAGFLLQDDPDLLLDYLTLNFNAPPGESLTARQFDPEAGRFVSAAVPILPGTLSPAQLSAFSACHLLCCSTFNPGLAALVTGMRQVWLIDFLGGDYTNFMLDFEVDGVEFVRADLLLIWSKAGGVAFYQLFLGASEEGVEVSTESARSNQSNQMSEMSEMSQKSEMLTSSSTAKLSIDTTNSIDTSTSTTPSPSPNDGLGRSRSPLLGRTVRRLDVCGAFVGPAASSRLHLKLLPSSESLLWMEVTGEGQGRVSTASMVTISFDSASMERTVYLSRSSIQALNLTTSEEGIIEGNEDGQIERNDCTIERNVESVEILNDSFPCTTTTTTAQSPVTCMITREPGHLLQGHFNGQLSLRPVISFFQDGNDHEVSFTSCQSNGHPITCLYSGDDLIVAGDLQGRLHFWRGGFERFAGATRAHVKRVMGVVKAGPWILSWSEGGVLAVHAESRDGQNQFGNNENETASKQSGNFVTVHVFHPPNNSNQLNAIYYKTTDSTLLLDYKGASRTAFTLIAPFPVLPLSDSAFMECIALADVKVSLTLPSSSWLFGGVIGTVPAVGWPSLPCHALIVDLRGLLRLSAVGSNAGVIGSSGGVVGVVGSNVALTESSENSNSSLVKAILLRLLAPQHQSNNNNTTSTIRYGLVGANGNVTCLLKSGPFWCRSPTLTATIQLAILSLLPALSPIYPDLSSLQTFYSVQVASHPSTLPASLSLISKFWQDPTPLIQQAARLIFTFCLNQLSEGQRNILLRYWIDLLPTSASASASMNRSTVILSIICLQDPSLLTSISPSLPKLLADALVNLLLQEEKRSLFRLAAVELIGRGYGAVWRPFMHGKSIFRLLISWYRTRNSSSSNDATITQCLLHILVAEGEQLISLLNDALSASPSTGLHLIRELIAFKPVVLLGREVSLVEGIIGKTAGEEAVGVLEMIAEQFGVVCMDPGKRFIAVADSSNSCLSNSNEGEKRDSIKEDTPSADATNQTPTTTNSFYIFIYDLKQRIKCATLQGHSQPSTLLHFLPFNKTVTRASAVATRLVSYSAGEATIRFWPLNALGAALSTSGSAAMLFFGTGNGVLDAGSVAGSGKTVIVVPELTEAVERVPVGSLGALKPVQGRVDDSFFELLVNDRVMMRIEI